MNLQIIMTIIFHHYENTILHTIIDRHHHKTTRYYEILNYSNRKSFWNVNLDNVETVYASFKIIH